MSYAPSAEPVAKAAIAPLDAPNINATATATAFKALLERFPRAALSSDVATQTPRASLQIDLKNLFMLKSCES
jgi:hypothetical protein